VVTLPLILLAIPSAIIGFFAIKPMLYGDFFAKGAAFANVIFVEHEKHPAMEELSHEFAEVHGAMGMALHSFTSVPFLLALAGVVLSYLFYMVKPAIPAKIKEIFAPIHTLLENKYYFDAFNQTVFAGGARKIGEFLWKFGDAKIIDGFFVNGAARMVNMLAQVVSTFQSGLIYQYAIAMLMGVMVFLFLFVTMMR
jgi:NADH-quinone oxidoreductase subunit L